MQNPDNLIAPCSACGALSGEPCVTSGGTVALRAHWGRPARSARLTIEREVAEGVQRYLDGRRAPESQPPTAVAEPSPRG